MNYLKSIVVVVFAGTTFAISLPVMAQMGDNAYIDDPINAPIITGNGGRNSSSSRKVDSAPAVGNPNVTGNSPAVRRRSSPATSNSSQIPNDDSNICPTVVLGANHPCGTQYKTIKNTVLRGSRRRF